ncbi:hypothetical protein V8D89_010080 [Ganoderma adspersum]
MSSLSRIIALGFQAVSLLVAAGPILAPLSALATPVPLPMPLMPHIADYAARTPVDAYAAALPVALGNSASLSQPGIDSAIVEGTPPGALSVVRRQGDLLATFVTYVGVLIDLSASGNDTTTQQQAVLAAGGIVDTLRTFQGFLNDQQKGLANFDPNDPLDVLLKNLINATKDALEAIDILVYRIPILGPLLGPIVYEVKCILDAILDLIENLTDGVINALLPDLRADLQVVIGVAVTVTCNTGSSPEGFCLAAR